MKRAIIIPVTTPDMRTATDKERAASLAEESDLTKAIGRARMQASLIKDASKICTRFQAMCHQFGFYHEFTHIFANRLIEIFGRTHAYSYCFQDGAKSRISGDKSPDETKIKDLGTVPKNLFLLGWVMADLKMPAEEHEGLELKEVESSDLS
jgi:hypothetical protein